MFKGFQLRFGALVFGSLLILLVFTGFHAFFLFKQLLPSSLMSELLPGIKSSTVRLFFAGAVYTCVVTLASLFMTHSVSGPAERLREEISSFKGVADLSRTLRIRKGDGLEGLANSLNDLLQTLRIKLEKDDIERRQTLVKVEELLKQLERAPEAEAVRGQLEQVFGLLSHMKGERPVDYKKSESDSKARIDYSLGS